MGTFYITTAIDYPNGQPHMGHAYEKVVSDVYARWYRLHGKKTHFLTGTDENGQKLLRAAEDEGQEVRPYLEEKVGIFKQLCLELGLSNDDFIRTTEARHLEATAKIWHRLLERKHIYFDKYKGYYCLACESFYTETQAPDLICPNHNKALEFVEEEGYFLRISAFANWIKSYISEQKDFVVPHSARAEMLGRLNADPLRDLSISRPNQGWGIEVPGEPKHVIYTWFDALINYYAAVTEEPLVKPEFWPADMHVIGKDITWFHAVIWPIMLKAAELPLPKQIYVHGTVLASDGKKMSKSLGNGVDPFLMIQTYGIESFRYYLLRAIGSGQDGAFQEKDLRERHNTELANIYGNTLQRVAKFGLKVFGAELSPPRDLGLELDLKSTYAAMQSHMEDRDHHKALDALWAGIAQINVYLNQHEPWRIKDQPERVHQIVYSALHAMHAAGALVEPFMPRTSLRTFQILGVPEELPLAERFIPTVFRLNPGEGLFPRFT